MKASEGDPLKFSIDDGSQVFRMKAETQYDAACESQPCQHLRNSVDLLHNVVKIIIDLFRDSQLSAPLGYTRHQARRSRLLLYGEYEPLHVPLQGAPTSVVGCFECCQARLGWHGFAVGISADTGGLSYSVRTLAECHTEIIAKYFLCGLPTSRLRSLKARI